MTVLEGFNEFEKTTNATAITDLGMETGPQGLDTTASENKSEYQGLSRRH